MARFRLAGAAQADLVAILDTSLDRWGEAGRSRYEALLEAAMRSIAADPEGPLTRARAEYLQGIRSFHVRHVRCDHGVKAPVHVVYYRIGRSNMIEIVRVLHERTEPSLHLAGLRSKRRLRRR
jgi:toxin ParE1/3/4